MLSPFRVLDLTDESGQLCGQILADLGADVVIVEPPQGSSARRIGPFRGGSDDSLFLVGSQSQQAWHLARPRC